MHINESGAGAGGFHTTRWSLLSQLRGSFSDGQQDALAELCQNYWPPLYGFARRQGRDSEDAKDFVQGFFAVLLEKGYLANADAEKGRFRTFLLTAFKRYLINEHKRENAVKRGGGCAVISLDDPDAERRCEGELADNGTLSADVAYDRGWAQAILGRVIGRLSDEFNEADKLQRFEHLKGFLIAGGGASYSDVARDLGMSEPAVKSAICRMRERFRQLFRIEIENTVADPREVDDEIRYLSGVLAH